MFGFGRHRSTGDGKRSREIIPLRFDPEIDAESHGEVGRRFITV